VGRGPASKLPEARAIKAQLLMSIPPSIRSQPRLQRPALHPRSFVSSLPSLSSLRVITEIRRRMAAQLTFSQLALVSLLVASVSLSLVSASDPDPLADFVVSGKSASNGENTPAPCVLTFAASSALSQWQ
jgi:hypothetical protein